MLLTHLPPQGLLFQILELKLVEDAADLNCQGRVLVAAVETVSHGHHPHTLEGELRQHRKHEVVVASQAREIVSQDRLELTRTRGLDQGGEAFAIRARP